MSMQEFESQLTLAYRLAQEQVIADKLEIGGKEIIMVRGVPFIIDKKLDKIEKNNFTYYQATRLNIGPIQKPELKKEEIKNNHELQKRTLIVEYKEPALHQLHSENFRVEKGYYEYTHLWINYIPASKEIIGNQDEFWSYGAQISDVRAYLAVAVLEKMQ